MRSLALVIPLACTGFGCGDDDSEEAKPESDKDGGAAADAAAPRDGAIARDGGGELPSGDAVWSMMGYDARNNYRQPAEKTLGVANASEIEEKWRFKVAGFPAGSPSIAEGRVFVMSTGATYAIDLASGAEIWKNSDVAGTASLAWADGKLYAHTTGALLYKLNAADGAIEWGPIATYPEQELCDGTSSPIVAGGKVLVGHSCGGPEVSGGDAQSQVRGGVEAFDIANGDRLWTYYTVPESGENGAMVWSTVGVDLAAKVVFATTGNNYTLIGGGSDAFHAIDLESGERKWLSQTRAGDVWSYGNEMTWPGEDTDFGANPILADVAGKTLVAAGDKGSAFWALDRETGETLWTREELSASHGPSTGGVLNNGGFDGKNFYVASNEPPADSVLHVLDPATGEDVHEPLKLGALVWGAPSFANGLMILPVDSTLRIYDASTLEELTSFETGGTIAAGAAAIANGRIVVKSGLQYIFAPDAKNNDQVICYGLPD